MKLKFHSFFTKPNILPDEVFLNDGYVDVEKAETIAISGLDSYHETKRLTRLSYAKPEVETRDTK